MSERDMKFVEKGVLVVIVTTVVAWCAVACLAFAAIVKYLLS